MRWKRTFTVVGCHAAGEVGNVVVGSVMDVPGNTMFEKKEYMEQSMDDLRQLLLFEPRGAPYVNANIILPPCEKSADLGFLILESTEYPPMSGSNTMCVATVALETGMVPMVEPVTHLHMEAPGGMIEVRCTCLAGKVTEVELTNVPGFALHLDAPIEVPGLGTVTLDTSYGGMLYAHVNAHRLGFAITPDEAHEMCLMGQRIKRAVNEQLQVVHPQNSKIKDVSNVIFEGDIVRSQGQVQSRSGTVVLHGRLNRSPCGTGTTGRLAVMAAKGQIARGEMFRHISISDTHFNAHIVEELPIGPFGGVIAKIAGQAWITSIGQYGVDPTDPYRRGHKVSDVWF